MLAKEGASLLGAEGGLLDGGVWGVFRLYGCQIYLPKNELVRCFQAPSWISAGGGF